MQPPLWAKFRPSQPIWSLLLRLVDSRPRRTALQRHPLRLKLFHHQPRGPGGVATRWSFCGTQSQVVNSSSPLCPALLRRHRVSRLHPRHLSGLRHHPSRHCRRNHAGGETGLATSRPARAASNASSRGAAFCSGRFTGASISSEIPYATDTAANRQTTNIVA
jgi:hypothetical protein